MAPTRPGTSYKEDVFPSLLTIRVVSAKNITSGDVVTEADCYVYLWVPSSSEQRFKTKTVSNTTGPFWGETFEFKIYSNIKNILHLSLKDEDVITLDDHLYTVHFDVGELPQDETVVKNFALNPEGQEELEVELKITKMSDDPEKIITNGVIVSREVTCLEVTVDKQKSAKVFKDDEELVLSVNGSFKERVKTPLTSASGATDTYLFHALKSWDAELTARVEDAPSVIFSQPNSGTHESVVTVPLKMLPVGEKVNVALPVSAVPSNCCSFCCHRLLPKVKEKKLEMEVKVCDCSDDIDMRLGFGLCQGEKDFLQKRKAVVASAVKAALGLERDLQDHEVPVIAVCATGGGARAMTSFFGTLSGLKKTNLLDCVSYVTGASGSTWTMSKLYEDADWSTKDLGERIADARKHMVKSKLGAFSWDRLKYYYNELDERAKDGHPASFTDLWGLIIESMYYDGENQATLSDQQKAVDRGQNPLPLYLAMNVKNEDKSTVNFKEWCEFSPYEVGLIKYGAFIRAEHFDSEFFMGRLVRKLKESRLCYLIGLWSNIFSINFLDAWYAAVSSDSFWERWAMETVAVMGEDDQLREIQSSNLNTNVVGSEGMLSSALQNILTNRPLGGEHHNFLKGFQIHEDYHTNRELQCWKDTDLDMFPYQLTPSADKLCLVDSAYYINASFPPILRDERKVDIILSFDYSRDESFKSVIRTCEYCTKQGIAFPKVALKEEDKEKTEECYVFTCAENPDAPIVLHFPLVNDTFRTHKAPGVERSPTEMEGGDVQLTGRFSPYLLVNMTYAEDNFDKLVNLTEYNVMNNRDAIVQAFRTVIDRKTNGRT